MPGFTVCPKCEGSCRTPAGLKTCGTCKGTGTLASEGDGKSEFGPLADVPAMIFAVQSQTCLILGRPHQLWQNMMTMGYEWRQIPSDLAAAALAFNLPADIKVIK